MKMDVDVKDFLKEYEEQKEKEATDKKHVKMGLNRREPVPPCEPKRGYDGR